MGKILNGSQAARGLDFLEESGKIRRTGGPGVEIGGEKGRATVKRQDKEVKNFRARQGDPG